MYFDVHDDGGGKCMTTTTTICKSGKDEERIVKRFLVQRMEFKVAYDEVFPQKKNH